MIYARINRADPDRDPEMVFAKMSDPVRVNDPLTPQDEVNRTTLGIGGSGRVSHYRCLSRPPWPPLIAVLHGKSCKLLHIAPGLYAAEK